jgi:hypothetical protein
VTQAGSTGRLDGPAVCGELTFFGLFVQVARFFGLIVQAARFFGLFVQAARFFGLAESGRNFRID